MSQCVRVSTTSAGTGFLGVVPTWLSFGQVTGRAHGVFGGLGQVSVSGVCLHLRQLCLGVGERG